MKTTTACLAACCLVDAALGTAVNKTVEIAPGVHMPTVNCGGVTSKPSNYSAFFEAGGRGVDTALTYGTATQESVGAAIKASGLARSAIFLTTKVPCCPQALVGAMCSGYTGSIADDVAQDLKELEVDYVDLMLLHWSCDTMDETVAQYKQLQGLVAAGKARAIGISNFNSTAIAALAAAPGVTVAPAVNQCGYSIANHDNKEPGLGRDDATREYCEQHGIAYEAYSPLGGLSDVDVLGNAQVKAIAAAHGVGSAQVALRWVAQQGGLVVTAAEDPEYLAEDLDIYGFELTDMEMKTLSAIN